jgi:hypothetical protein
MDPAEFIESVYGGKWSTTAHCWDLVRRGQREVLGREVPEVLISDKLEARALVRMFEDHPERMRWIRVNIPENGAIVLMNKGGRHGRAIHAGIYFDLDGGGILHVDDPHGVVFEDALAIQLRGWTCDFYIPG